MTLHISYYIFCIIAILLKLSPAFIILSNDSIDYMDYNSLFNEKHGEESNTAEFPYLVSVRVEDIHICTGSLYSTKLAITSAQCCYDWVIYKISGKYIQHATHLVTLLWATSLLDSYNHTESYSIAEVELILAHERFDFITLENDIALLKLKHPLKVSQFAPLLPLGVTRINDLEGKTCTLAGWGAFRFIISEFINELNITERMIMLKESTALLQKTSLDVVSAAECSNLTSSSSWNMDNMLCVFNEGRSACVGEAGSPLICDDYVVALLSWHGGCVRDTPGVFHRLDKLANAFHQHSQEEEKMMRDSLQTFLLFLDGLVKNSD